MNPYTKTVQTHILHAGEYITHVYADSDEVPVHVLEGCVINMEEVFADMIGVEEQA